MTDRSPIGLDRRFAERFGRAPRLFRAPGRVNLIGEHTDYNDGFVMPAAIALEVGVAAAPRGDRDVVVYSEEFEESARFALEAPDPRPRGHWSDYVQGVALALQGAGMRLRGADLLIRGDVPRGAGLSSSAALEVAVGCALCAVSDLRLDPTHLARFCQRAENDFVGARTGIMDPYAACHGRAGHALLLDCRSLRHRSLPLPAAARLVICDSGVRHAHAAGEYNQRREECEAGARILGVAALRDAAPEDVERARARLGETVYRRCRHVVGENARVLAAAAALESGDLEGFGRCMRASHQSLRDDFAVSCPELDRLVELAGARAECWGARMTGGGFGGCTVSLVRAEAVDGFRAAVAGQYGREARVYVTEAADGAGEMPRE